MTAALGTRLDQSAVEVEIRRSYWGGDDTFRLHECATAYINTLIVAGADRSPADVLADITTVMTALNSVEDDIWTEKGWHDRDEVAA